MNSMHWWNDTENCSAQRNTCPSGTLSTSNLIWIDLGSNLGIHSERPANNRLSDVCMTGQVVPEGYS